MPIFFQNWPYFDSITFYFTHCMMNVGTWLYQSFHLITITLALGLKPPRQIVQLAVFKRSSY